MLSRCRPQGPAESPGFLRGHLTIPGLIFQQFPTDFSVLAVWHVLSHLGMIDDLDTLQAQVDLERSLVDALQAEYNELLAELRVALQRQAELRTIL
jgi:hypothetical protein